MATDKDLFAKLRECMILEQISARGISDDAIINAIRKIPRHEFVPNEYQEQAYSDRPVSIGEGQTISQPYVTALMIQELELQKEARVLEIGTGSGYQTALLAELVSKVYTIEIIEELALRAQSKLLSLGLNNIEFRIGSGFDGWPEEAPFEAIIISAAPTDIPRELVKELQIGGRMILPLGDEQQELVLIEKTPQGLVSRELGGVRFVPMV